jgi:hypothetical protein
VTVDDIAPLRAKVFPGVYIVGGFYLANGTSGQSWFFPDLSIAQMDEYDAVTTYNYPFAPHR